MFHLASGFTHRSSRQISFLSVFRRDLWRPSFPNDWLCPFRGVESTRTQSAFQIRSPPPLALPPNRPIPPIFRRFCRPSSPTTPTRLASPPPSRSIIASAPHYSYCARPFVWRAQTTRSRFLEIISVFLHDFSVVPPFTAIQSADQIR